MSLYDEVMASVVMPTKVERRTPSTAKDAMIAAFGQEASRGPGAPIGSIGQRSHPGFDPEILREPCSLHRGCDHDHGPHPYGPEFAAHTTVHDWKRDGWTVQQIRTTAPEEVHHHCVYCWWFGDLGEHFCEVIEMLAVV